MPSWPRSEERRRAGSGGAAVAAAAALDDDRASESTAASSSTAATAAEASPDEDCGSWSGTPVSSTVANDHMELDRSTLDDLDENDVAGKFYLHFGNARRDRPHEVGAVARMTVLDECVAFRGDYWLQSHGFDGHPCYQKEDGSMFLFFNSLQGGWRFGAELGHPASDELGALNIVGGVQQVVPAFTMAAAAVVPELGAKCALPTPPPVPCEELLDAPSTSEPRMASDSTKASAQNCPEPLLAVCGSTGAGSSELELQAGALHLSVIDDNDEIRGEYRLLCGSHNGWPCYQKEDGSMFLFVDDEHRRWRFRRTLGSGGRDGAALPMVTLLANGSSRDVVPLPTSHASHSPPHPLLPPGAYREASKALVDAPPMDASETKCVGCSVC